MTDQDKDHHLLLSRNVELQRYVARSASMSSPLNATFESDNTFISHTGPLLAKKTTEFAQSGPLYANPKSKNVAWRKHGKHQNKAHAITPEEFGQVGWSNSSNSGRHEHLLKSGPLGLCNDPDCISCPAAYKTKTDHYRGSISLDRKLHNILYGDSDGWAWKLFSSLKSHFPVMNPHTKVVQQWNKFFVISCLVAIFIDPLFFFLLTVRKENKCIVLNWPLATAIAAIRSVTDFIYLLHMLLQFRLAYVAPESTVVGAGDLVDQPKKIAVHYLRGYFALDVFVLLPLPQPEEVKKDMLVEDLSRNEANLLKEKDSCSRSQMFEIKVMILAVIPNYVRASSANYAKNLLRAIVLLQYVPRIIRVLPLLSGQSASGFIFESAWANFVINLLMFVLAGHVVGSCWYLFGLQRVNQCLRDTCSQSKIQSCASFIDCGRGNIGRDFESQPAWYDWRNDSNSSNCFSADGDFQYGIYQQVVNLTTENSIATRYVYSLFWGFQQISTLAGNLDPSYFVWEVLFTMAIIGLGLLLFALLIGNMQNFLLALGRRRLDMQLRRRDVEQWMSHRRLPEELRRKVRQAERFSWAASRGSNEEQLLENLPEDLQRDLRRHFFQFLKKVQIFALMDDPMLDAVFEKLRQTLYIRGNDILYHGGPIEKMVFIVRGKMESIGADGTVAPLSEGDVCGEELLTFYLEQHSLNKESGKVRLAGLRLFSNRTVRCLTNVEAFALRAADLEQITSLFSRFLRHPRVQAEIRFQSPYWRCKAATHIQVAWRYRRKRLKRANTSKVNRPSAHANSHFWRQQ